MFGTQQRPEDPKRIQNIAYPENWVPLESIRFHVFPLKRPQEGRGFPALTLLEPHPQSVRAEDGCVTEVMDYRKHVATRSETIKVQTPDGEWVWAISLTPYDADVRNSALPDVWDELVLHERYRLLSQCDDLTQSETAWVKEQERLGIVSPVRTRFVFNASPGEGLHWHRGRGVVYCEVFLVPEELLHVARQRRAPKTLATLYNVFYEERPISWEYRRDFSQWELACIPQVCTKRSRVLVALEDGIPAFDTSSVRGMLVDSLEADALARFSGTAEEEQAMLRQFLAQEEEEDAKEGDDVASTSAASAIEDAALTQEEEATENDASKSGVTADTGEADAPERPLERAGSSAHYTWTAEAQPRALFGKRLYEYQLQALAWMKSVERNGGHGYRYGVQLRDLAAEQVFRKHNLDQSALRGIMRARGGILADEMGLGKSLVMIALILAHQRGQDTTMDKAFSRDMAGLPGGGTLIMCPSHLVRQWKNEIEENTPLACEILTTTAQWSKISYARMLAADVVIVSHSFLTNSSHKSALPSLDVIRRVDQVLPDEPAGGTRRVARTRRSRRTAEDAPPEFSLSLCMTCPVLQKIDWHRIVLDEGHELIGTATSMEVEEMLAAFRSTFRWVVSGTPLPHMRSFQEIQRFLCCTVAPQSLRRVYGRPSFGEDLCRLLEREVFLQSLYWRNTKETAKTADKIPAIVEEVIWIRHSDVEAAMYNAAAVTNDVVRMRQLCCHPQISARDREVLGDAVQTLDEIRERLVSHNNKKMNTFQRTLADEKDSLENFRLREHGKAVKRENKLVDLIEEHGDDSKEVNEFIKKKDAKDRERIREDKRRVRSIEKIEQEILDEQKRGEYFSALVPRASEAIKEPCLVCFEDIGLASVTKCGHVFCSQCIRSAVTMHHNCPMCRTPLGPRDFSIVKDQSKDCLVTDTLATKHGAKMARLIMFLRQVLGEDPEHKVIVFSQWDAMLLRIGDTLAAEVRISC